MVFLIMFAIGLTSAVFGSIAGLGGGIIFVPSLILLSEFMDSLSWVTPQSAVAMSLLAMVFTSLSSTMTFIKRKRVDVKSGFLFLAGSLPGALTGVFINRFVNPETFEFLLAAIMVVIVFILSIKKFFPRKEYDENHTKKLHVHRTFRLSDYEVKYSYSIILGVLIGFIVGTLSGLFGIGGGSLMVPAMVLLFGFPAHIAVPTSLFMIFFSSLLASTTHIIAGHIVWLYALAAIPGSYLGGYIGAWINQRMRSETVEWVLRITLIIAAIRLMF